jgi:hypothetical protein
LRTLRHLVQSMRRRVDKLFRKHGGYTRYWPHLYW